jgi:uronate dehydrogenase
MQRVLLTGAAGGVGTMVRTLLRQLFPELVLSDMREPEALRANEPFRRADLTDLAAVEAAVEGMEGILHVVGGEKVGHGSGGVVLLRGARKGSQWLA